MLVVVAVAVEVDEEEASVVANVYLCGNCRFPTSAKASTLHKRVTDLLIGPERSSISDSGQ